MLIKNKSARLIGFSWNKVKYNLMPAGPAVEVPDDAAKSAFLKGLLRSKDVEKVVKLSKEVPDNAAKSAFLKGLLRSKDVEKVVKLSKEELAAAELEGLRDQAISLGIEVNEKWGSKKISAEIAKKKES